MIHQTTEKSKLVENMKADLYPAMVIRTEMKLRIILEECKVNCSSISSTILYFLVISLSFWKINRMQNIVGEP